jgi:hypothetical protein
MFESQIATGSLKKAVFAGAALAMLALAAPAANAATTTLSFDIDASDFIYSSGPTGGTPVDPVMEDITVTFNPALNDGPTSSGLVVTNFTLSDSSEFIYASGGNLTIATLPVFPDMFNDSPGSYGLVISNPLTAPTLAVFEETDANGESWTATDLSATTPSAIGAVPEPGTLALFGAGLMCLATFAGVNRRKLAKL